MRLSTANTAFLTLSLLLAGCGASNSNAPQAATSPEFDTALSSVSCNGFSTPPADLKIELLHAGDAYRGVYNPEKVRLRLNLDSITDDIDKLNLPPQFVQEYWNAVLFHEECVHSGMRYPTIMFESPIAIPKQYSGYGYEIVGVKGPTLLTRMRYLDQNGTEIDEIMELHQISELFAMYYMWNNPSVPHAQEILEIGGKNIVNHGRYQLASALYKYIDFQRAFLLFQKEDEESVYEAWKIMLGGKDVRELDADNIPVVLWKISSSDTGYLDPSTYPKELYDVDAYRIAQYFDGSQDIRKFKRP